MFQTISEKEPIRNKMPYVYQNLIFAGIPRFILWEAFDFHNPGSIALSAVRNRTESKYATSKNGSTS